MKKQYKRISSKERIGESEKQKHDVIAIQKEKMASAKTTIGDLENQIFNIEGVRIVFRTRCTNEIAQYPYHKRSNNDMTLKSFVEYRINKVIDTRYDFVIVDGYGNRITIDDYETMSQLRSTYRRITK